MILKHILQLVLKLLKVSQFGRLYLLLFKDIGGFPQLPQRSHDNHKNILKSPNYLLSIYTYLLSNLQVP